MRNSIKRSAIGLTMDSTELRAVEVAFAPHPYVVTAGSIALQPGLIRDGLITDLPAVSGLLSELLRTYGFSSAPFVIGAKNENMLLRLASLPRVPDDKLRTTVMLQAQQFIPVPVRELVLDYVFSGVTEQEGRAMADILLVGAKKAYVQSLIELLRSVGGTLANIDAAVLGLVRMAETRADKPGEVYLVADIDHDGVNIVFLEENHIRLARAVMHEVPLQSNAELTEEAQNRVVNSLAENIRTSMLYYANLHPGEAPARVLLTGVVPQLKEIARQAEEKLALEVSVPSVYQQVDGISQEELPAYALGISLALSAEQAPEPTVQLLPEEYKRNQTQNQKLLKLRKRLTAGAAVLLAVALGSFGVCLAGNAQIVAVRNERTALEGKAASMSEYRVLYQQKTDLLSRLVKAETADPKWMSAFHAIVNALPQDAWIERFTSNTTEDNVMKCELQCGGVNYDSVANTTAALQNCEVLSSAVCTSTTESEGGMTFTLSLTLTDPATR